MNNSKNKRNNSTLFDDRFLLNKKLFDISRINLCLYYNYEYLSNVNSNDYLILFI